MASDICLSQEEFLDIMSTYGPEKNPTDLDFRKLKPSQCFLKRDYLAWNPTFADRFYLTSEGKWLTCLGVEEEQEYRQLSRLCWDPKRLKTHGMVRLSKGKMALLGLDPM
jgi:hypothetical protein